MQAAAVRHFGRPLLSVALGDLLVSEHWHAPHEQIAAHRHEEPYICIVTAGSYAESSRARTLQASEGAVLGHEAGAHHANAFEAAGGRCLNVSAAGAWRDNASWADWLQRRSAAPGRLERHAVLRLQRELAQPGPANAFGLAAALFEAMAADAENARLGPVPAWLHRLRQRIDAAPCETHSLAALAAEAGVHPSHMARAFRQWTGQSIGEYSRRLRLELALRELPHASAAEVAARHGFADQAHFSRAVRRATGLTPRAYKNAQRVQ